MTQGDLAGSDYSVGFISRIESGARQPSPHTLTTLAGRLSVSPEFLLTGAEEVDALARRHDLDRAELALAGGDIDEAMTVTTEMLETSALSPWPDLVRRARVVHALCYEAMGDLHSAIIELEDLASSYDGGLSDAPIGIALSRCYREVGDYPQAISAGEGLLRSMELLGLSGATEHVRLSVTVAAAYYESGQLGVAIRMARRAIKAAEANASPEAQAAAYWNASVFEREAGYLERAVAYASKALALLENGSGTRNLARLRTTSAIIQLHDPHADTQDLRDMLELARRELDWSSAGPLDRAYNMLAFARLSLREADPHTALQHVRLIPADVCHQDPMVSAAVSVVAVLAKTIAGDSYDGEFAEAAAVLTMMGADRGAAQLWFELGEAADASGDPTRATMAYRQSAICLGAARILLPMSDRAAFSIPAHF